MSALSKSPLTSLVVVLLVATGTAACSSASSPPARTPTPLYSTTSQATKVGASQLFADYAKHAKIAEKLYHGKLLGVTGVISRIDTDPILNAPEAILSAGAGSAGGRGIDCVFDKRFASEVAKLHVGQEVTVLGVCQGYAVNVLLLRCQPSSAAQ